MFTNMTWRRKQTRAKNHVDRAYFVIEDYSFENISEIIHCKAYFV